MFQFFSSYNLNEKETLEDSQYKYSGASGELIERVSNVMKLFVN